MGELFMRFPDGREFGIDQNDNIVTEFDFCDKCQTRRPTLGGRVVRVGAEILLFFCQRCESKR